LELNQDLPTPAGGVVLRVTRRGALVLARHRLPLAERRESARLANEGSEEQVVEDEPRSPAREEA
jgi:hypothetical protein